MTTSPVSAPSPGASAGRSRSALLALVQYTLRTAAPAKRILQILPTVALLLFALIAKNQHSITAVQSYADVVGFALFHLIVPITCLIVGDSVLGSELRAGTFAFTWLSPVPHYKIVLGRWLGGWIISSAMLVPGVILSGLVAGASGVIGPALIATVAASAAYLAVFIAIGVTFQRPIIWSLVFVMLIERLLGTALDGIAQVTPGWLGDEALLGLKDLVSERQSIPHGWSAVIRIGIVTAVMLALSVYRLTRLRPASASD